MNQVTTIKTSEQCQKSFDFAKFKVPSMKFLEFLGKLFSTILFWLIFHYILVLNFRLIHIAESDYFT